MKYSRHKLDYILTQQTRAHLFGPKISDVTNDCQVRQEITLMEGTVGEKDFRSVLIRAYNNQLVNVTNL